MPVDEAGSGYGAETLKLLESFVRGYWERTIEYLTNRRMTLKVVTNLEGAVAEMAVGP